MAFNKVILQGNLTRDPETRATNGGSTVVNFSVAVTRNFKNKDGEYDTDFIECDAWGPRGETIAKYFTKGNPILVEGTLRQDSWEDKETGKKRSTLRVNVDNFSFIGRKNDGDNAPASTSASNTVKDEGIDAEGEVDLSDIPF